MEHKVIFLDIDGVLNSALSLYAGEYTKTWNINKTILKAYKKFTEKHDIKTVVSSTWREKANGSLFEMEKIILNDSGIHLKIDGMTDVLNKSRGIEIDKYIKENNVKNYAIIDDGKGFLEYQLTKLVQTDISLGMTLYDIKKLAEVLEIDDRELKFI